MNFLDISILLALGLWLFFALRSIGKRKGGCGGCKGCGGSCAACKK